MSNVKAPWFLADQAPDGRSTWIWLSGDKSVIAVRKGAWVSATVPLACEIQPREGDTLVFHEAYPCSSFSLAIMRPGGDIATATITNVEDFGPDESGRIWQVEWHPDSEGK